MNQYVKRVKIVVIQMKTQQLPHQKRQTNTNPSLRIGCFLRGAQPPYILLRGEKDLTYSDEEEITSSRILGEELPMASGEKKALEAKTSTSQNFTSYAS